MGASDRIGILSDSHGQVERTRRAVAALADAGANRMIHLGDIETEAVLEELLALPTHLVFGNCDWPIEPLHDHAIRLGISVEHPLGRIDVNGRAIAFTHGHDQKLLSQPLFEGTSYLLHGHTHRVRDERVGLTRVINPGALHRAAVYTVALLEPDTDTLTTIEVD